MARKSKKIKMTEEEAQLKGIEKTGKFFKICHYCNKPYYSDSRRQAFCCPEHAKLASKRKKESQARYKEIAPIETLRVQAHTLAVRIMLQLENMGLVKHECCECHAKGGDEGVILELHHKDLNWCNNTPSNLEWRCNKCHTKAHADLIHELDDKGIVLDEFYEESFLPFARALNKDKMED